MDYHRFKSVSSKIVYMYFAKEEIKELNDYELIGFKDSSPVLRPAKPCIKTEPSCSKDTSNMESKTQNPEKSDKKTYIILNGKKVQVVPLKFKGGTTPLESFKNIPSVATDVKKSLSMPEVDSTKVVSGKFGLPISKKLLMKSKTINIQMLQPFGKVGDCPAFIPKTIDTKSTEHVQIMPFKPYAFNKFKLKKEGDLQVMKNMNNLKTYSKGVNKNSSKCKTIKQDNSEIKAEEDTKRVILTNTISTSCDGLINTADVQIQTDSIENSNKVDVSTQTHLSNLNFESVLQASKPTEGIDLQDEWSVDLDSDFLKHFVDDFGGSTHKSNAVANKNSDSEKLRLQFHEDLKNCLIYNTKGNLPIHEGVLQNDPKLVRRNCVVLKARQEGVSVLNQDNMTPLQLAVLHDTLDIIIELLVSFGAELGSMDSEGNNVLHLVVEHNQKSALKILLRYARKINFDIDSFNYEGLSPLMLCCVTNNLEMAEIMLEHGAQPNLRDLKSGRTALFHASENHDLEMVKLLLKYDADTKIRNFFGTSPHDAMFEVEDIPQEIKYVILGKGIHTKSVQKRKTTTTTTSNLDKEEKRKKYCDNSLKVVRTFRKVNDFQSS